METISSVSAVKAGIGIADLTRGCHPHKQTQHQHLLSRLVPSTPHSIWPGSPMGLVLKEREHSNSLPLHETKSMCFTFWIGGGPRAFTDTVGGFYKTEQTKPETALSILYSEVSSGCISRTVPLANKDIGKFIFSTLKAQELGDKYHEQSRKFVPVPTV